MLSTAMFLTNNFMLGPAAILRMYKGRWQTELFFKALKQNLRRTFGGTTTRQLTGRTPGSSNAGNATNQPENSIFSPTPNPFHAMTRLAFTVPIGARTQVSIYDASGQRIGVLFNSMATGVLQDSTWHAGHISSGVYFVRLSVAHEFAIQRVVLVK